MSASLRTRAATVLVLLLSTIVNAQNVFFTNYPTQVVTGQFYPVSWISDGTAVTVNLLRAGIVEETLFTGSDGAVTSFTWEVDDDEDGGVDYALQLVPTGGAPVNSGSIWIIEDEDGLLVNGQLIFASVSNGPTASGLQQTTSATASTVMSVANAVTSPARTMQTVAFTTAGSSYTFVTAVVSTAVASASQTAETLTFVSNGLSFTTTINLSAATEGASPESASPPPANSSNSGNGGRLSAGAIAGIVVGVVVAVILLIIGCFWFRRQRRQHRRNAQSRVTDASTKPLPDENRRSLGEGKLPAVAEKGSGDMEKAAGPNDLIPSLSPNHHEMETPTQIPSSMRNAASAEVDGANRYEMNAAPPRYELAAESVPVEMESNVRNSVVSDSVTRAGTVNITGVASNGSVSAISNMERFESS